MIDDSAGWHQRVTEWRWSAGVGEGADGTPLAWNLVTGHQRPPQGSERAVWVDGAPHEAGPVEFAADLGAIRGEDGSELRFVAEAERARSENLLLVQLRLPRAVRDLLRRRCPAASSWRPGAGVMEHHRARW